MKRQLINEKFTDNKSMIRMKSLSRKEAIRQLESNCKQAIKIWVNGNVIYRGDFNYSDEFYLAIPTSTDIRKPFNFIDMIINNSKYWNKFPRRDIVCSTSRRKSYGYGNVYHVFPFDGAKIGICHEIDIWDSFHMLNELGFYWAKDFNDAMKVTFDRFAIHIDGKKWESFVKGVKELEDILMNSMNPERDLEYLDTYDMLMGWLSNYYIEDIKTKSLINYILEVTSPKPNNFDLCKIGDKLPYDDRELWLDSKCIFVSDDVIDTVFDY